MNLEASCATQHQVSLQRQRFVTNSVVITNLTQEVQVLKQLTNNHRENSTIIQYATVPDSGHSHFPLKFTSLNSTNSSPH
jgi:hypothetical protein